jgi:hypothetical protein
MELLAAASAASLPPRSWWRWTGSHLIYLLAYAAPTVVPFFVSRVSLARMIGSMLVVSLFASAAVQRDTLTSVWCFFAAILSGLMLVAVAREQPLRSRVRPIPNV